MVLTDGRHRIPSAKNGTSKITLAFPIKKKKQKRMFFLVGWTTLFIHLVYLRKQSDGLQQSKASLYSWEGGRQWIWVIHHRT